MQKTFEALVVEILNRWLSGLITENEALVAMIDAAIEFDIILDFIEAQRSEG